MKKLILTALAVLTLSCAAPTAFARQLTLGGQVVGIQIQTEGVLVAGVGAVETAEGSRSPAEAVAALKAGRVDFVIADIDPAKNCVKGENDLAISDFVTSEDYAIAIKKGRPDLLKVIDETIAEIKADGRLAKWIADFTAEADSLKNK